jgi:hypothetical protein
MAGGTGDDAPVLLDDEHLVSGAGERVGHMEPHVPGTRDRDPHGAEI